MSDTKPSSLMKVFVYGTLKRNQPNHYWFWKPNCGYAQFLTTGKTLTKFPLVVATRYYVPFLLNRKGTGNRITGEVYEIDSEMLANLDILENYPLTYNREILGVELENGDIIDCWIYYLREFPEVLLSRPLLTEYSDQPDKPYLEKSKRKPDYPLEGDLEYISQD